MNALKAPDRPRAEFAGSGLWVPALQPQPQALHAVAPAPCTQKCPAGVQVKAYVSLIAEQRFGEALEVIRRRCPLPGVCGRICHHPCEAACRRQRYDDAIAIRALKRYVADNERDFPRPSPPPGPQRAARVAVIGSGPAGLTAAYDLRLSGYPVTVFEGGTEPGGMLRTGIASYRLPRDILDDEIEVLARTGMDIRTGVRVGIDIELEQIAREFSATLLAVGAQHGRKLGVEHEHLYPEVEDALAFLRRVNTGSREAVGRRILVIGGGSTAIEAARASRRLGAESVQVLYRRSREELLAASEEIEAAEREGVHFRFLVAPVRAVGDGPGLNGLECAEVGLRDHDDSGRRRPVLIPGTEFVLPADRVLAAVGQDIDFGFLPNRSRDDVVRSQRIVVDEATSMTRISNVFAAGDMVSGPATVIEAIASGHRAAESIRHLIEEGRADIREQRPERRAAPEYELVDHPPLELRRLEPEMKLPSSGDPFLEVEQVFDRNAAVSEARRCLRCGPCGECRICATTCERRQVLVRETGDRNRPHDMVVRVPASVALSLDDQEPARGWILPRAEPVHGSNVDTRAGIEVELLPMRSHIRTERCRGCGTCVEACPFDAITVKATSDRRPAAVIDPARCRGCNLCVGVCPTHAAEGTALSPSWWAARLDAILPVGQPRPPSVVLACQRRAGSRDDIADPRRRRLELIRFRCIGQLQAGMLLQLLARGAPRVLVAGCATDRCRFCEGANLASQQIAQARGVLREVGQDDWRIDADWSVDRAHDRLDETVDHFLAKAPKKPRRKKEVRR